MSRSRRPRTPRPKTATPAPPTPPPTLTPTQEATAFWSPTRVWLAVVALLLSHATLAVRSLVLENPTVDEVVHLPAGLTYWQTGSFRLYHHNPPLVKLVAALPVLASNPRMDYRSEFWTRSPPNKMAIAHLFMEANASRYFELFTRARLMMPWFSIVGGLVVFAWSRSLYGPAGGLLSLALWSFCPNVLAHARLVTTDVGAASLGALATYLFWRDLKAPSWRRALAAGVGLGLAELTKFSLVILYALWPAIAALRLAIDADFRRRPGQILGHAVAIVGLSVLVIDLGYGFEGVGLPLGRHEFVSQTFTRPVLPGMRRPQVADEVLNGAYRFRVNRVRGTLLGALPIPLPSHYLTGFDEQKLEAEGIPNKFLNPALTGPEGDALQGYPVYLDGELRQKSWWYYYLMTLVYKVPEGTWALVLASVLVLAFANRAGTSGFDEFAVLVVPAFILFVMSVFTNINLGLRYVLPIFPFVYISAGKLGPWAQGFLSRGARRAAWGFIAVSLSATIASVLLIHPHYLAYFNAVSGGPSRGAEHLIDSNIDWGQDLVNLRRWLARHAPGETVGLAYFGQVNPRVFEARGEGFDWFLPPPEPGTMNRGMPPRYQFLPEIPPIAPGLYAASVTLVHGLPWRVYDSPWNGMGKSWSPWSVWIDAFGYFRELTPIDQVGHSILIYRVTPEDAARLSRHWTKRPP